MKFLELEPLNTRKNGGYAATREANSGIRKKPAAAVARETSSAAARLPQATAKRAHGHEFGNGRPARAWSADRAGRHFSDDVLSLRMTSVIGLPSTHG